VNSYIAQDCSSSYDNDLLGHYNLCTVHAKWRCPLHSNSRVHKNDPGPTKKQRFNDLFDLSQTAHIQKQLITGCGKQFRMMSWNIQCLGGRFGQPPVRDDAVIAAIVEVIKLCDPHVVAVMEVLGEKGLKEIARIADGLKAVHADWTWVTEKNGTFTGSETYAFFYRADCVKVDGDATYVTHDSAKNPLAFPSKKFRRPMQITFEMFGALRSSRGDWKLSGVVFHAPSPAHGQDTNDAVANLGKIAFPSRNRFIAADLNLPLDDGEDLEHAAKRAAAFEGVERLGFFDWLGTENPADSTIRRAAIVSISSQDEIYDIDVDDSAWDEKARQAFAKEMKVLIPNFDIDKVVPPCGQSHADYLAEWQKRVRETQTAQWCTSANYDQLLIATDDQTGSLLDPKTTVFPMLDACRPPEVCDEHGNAVSSVTRNSPASCT
jgi:hypothetical protein